jgi:hypothetical protein
VLGVAFQARTQRRAATLTNVYGHAPHGYARPMRHTRRIPVWSRPNQANDLARSKLIVRAADAPADAFDVLRGARR